MMKKIISLLSVMTISATAVPTTIAASPYQKQENKLKRSVKQSISDVITNTQLGFLNDNNKNTILAAVKAKNPNLDTIDVAVGGITNQSAHIVGSTFYDSNKYWGYETIYFTLKPNNLLISSNIHNYSHNKTYYLKNYSWSWTAEKINNIPEIKNVLIIKTIPNSNAVYFSTENGVYYMSENSWTANKINGIDEPISQIEIDKDNKVYFLGVSGYVYYLKNYSWSWTAEKIDNIPEIKNVLIIKTVPNSDAVYFTTENGVYYMSENSWTANKINGIDETISQIEIEKDNKVYFLGFSGYVYYLKNYSWSWTAEKINNIPEIKNVLIIKTIPNSNAVYFSTENGVYYMSENSWTANKINGIDEPISQIEIDKDNKVYFKSLFKISDDRTRILSGYNYNNQNPELIINDEDYEGSDYRTSLNNVFSYLIRERIIVPYGPIINGPSYVMNNQTGYFIVNINFKNTCSNKKLELVYNRRNLYIEGFIIRNGNNDNSPGSYYYFSDSTITNLNQQNLQNINFNLNSDYNSLRADNTQISWHLIVNSFRTLLKYNLNDNIRRDLVRVILVASESLRINDIMHFIFNPIYNNWNQFRPFLDWNVHTNNYLNSMNINIGNETYCNIDNNRLFRVITTGVVLSILHHKFNH